MKSLLEKLFAWLGSAMGDGESPSASRIIAVPSLLVINVLPCLVWVGLSIKAGSLLEVPGSVIGYVGSINTGLLVFVNAQKRLEVKG